MQPCHQQARLCFEAVLVVHGKWIMHPAATCEDIVGMEQRYASLVATMTFVSQSVTYHDSICNSDTVHSHNRRNAMALQI